MDWQSILNLVIGGSLALIGWLGRAMFDAVRRLEADMSEHRIEDAKTFATRDAMHDLRNEFAIQLAEMRKAIDGGLLRIFDKLDAKADK